VLVVAQQDGVDLPQLAGGEGGTGELRDAVPQPNLYLPPGGSNVGSVSSRQPSISINAVGPPMWVIRIRTIIPCRPLR
jgi:hypothetical protein